MFKVSVMSISLLLASLFDFFGGNLTPKKKNEKMMSNIVNTSIKQLNQRYGIRPAGIGGSEKEGKSKTEFIAFQLNKKLSKEEARILIIEIAELLLYNINGTPEITHYLYDNPFTYKNLEFVIYISDHDGSDLFHPDLGLASLTKRGTVKFVTYEPGRGARYATDVEEPYEEAYRIVTEGN